jgi:hypothetical protein
MRESTINSKARHCMTRPDGTVSTFAGFIQSRVVDGRIEECWQAWDFVTMLADLGAVPPDALARALQGTPLVP